MNFDRSALSKSFQLAQNGQVKNFVVADISRSGRDYIKTNEIMDVFLPTHNIHFIIIEDDANLNPKIGNLFSEWQERDQKQFIYTL